MGERPIYFQPGEWFHCFNRGVNKRRIFMSPNDYKRFQSLLYACNSAEPIHVSNYERGYRSKTLHSVLKLPRKTQLVDIGAYSLMPNHYHLLLRENVDGGLTSFMRKIGTAYTMYFNIRYERSGALYQGAFKAKHVRTDSYFERLLSYIHGNHAELSEPRWRQGVIGNEYELVKYIVSYPYASLRDYVGDSRAESAIVNTHSILDIVDRIPSPNKILSDARTFARQHADEAEM